MSDLVKRFNSDCISANIELQEKLTEKNRRIEQLERELAEANAALQSAVVNGAKSSINLAAEKALADRLQDDLFGIEVYAGDTLSGPSEGVPDLKWLMDGLEVLHNRSVNGRAAYRKARGAVMEAPQLIWIQENRYRGTMTATLEPMQNAANAEYIRRDLSRAEIERLEKEVEGLRGKVKHHEMMFETVCAGLVAIRKLVPDGSVDLEMTIPQVCDVFQNTLNTAWSDAIEAAVELCESKSGTRLDCSEQEYYIALGYELAAEDIRALKRSQG